MDAYLLQNKCVCFQLWNEEKLDGARSGLYGGCVNTLIFPKLMICGIDHCHARATTCDFEHCGILTSVDSDQPVQPPVKLRNSK